VTTLKARVGGSWGTLLATGLPGKPGKGVSNGGPVGDLLTPFANSDSGTGWQDVPSARLTKTSATAQSLTAGTFTPIAVDAVDYDTGGVTNIIAGTRMYAPRDGIYEVNGGVSVTFQTNNRLGMRVMLNDAIWCEKTMAVIVNNCAISIRTDVAMSAGDNVYCAIYSQVASTVIITSTLYTWQELRWVCPL
jgi:hypothetical protein